MSNLIAKLEEQLAQASSQRGKVDALTNLAFELVRFRQTERAAALAREAYDLSISKEFSPIPYAAGMAGSLTVQAYLDRIHGKYDLALEKCIQVFSLVDINLPSPSTIDALRLITWIYMYLGDYPNSLDYGLKGLNLARAGNFKAKESAMLDTLGRVYITSGDTELALQAHADALRISETGDDEMLKAVLLNNSANTLLEHGDYAQALEQANKSLEIVQRIGLKQRSEIYDTVGQILQKMGEYERAEQFLNEGLAYDLEEGEEMGAAWSYLSLGNLYLTQNNLEKAEDNFRQALKMAVKVGGLPAQMECYSKLCELAEKRKDWEQALIDHKAFYDVHIKIHSESASQRLAALKIAHQVETAKRDAEIYHLRNEELMREIEERKKAEKALEELAMKDPLTDLFNRRHFFNMAEIMLGQAMRYNHPLSVLIIDIDRFKIINDTYGHTAGDEAMRFLAQAIKRSIRSVDIAARFGGDEFVLLMPDTDTQQALILAKRLRMSMAERTIPTSRHAFQITLSIGVASINAESPTIDAILEQADRALYQAKQAGRNQIQIWGNPTG